MNERNEPNTEGSEAGRALEAILFLADEPMTAASLAQVVELPRSAVEALLRSTADAYQARGSGLSLRRFLKV